MELSFKILTLLTLAALAQNQAYSTLFSTNLASTCADLCLANGDTFCSNLERTSGTCYDGGAHLNLNLTEVICSSEFPALPVAACPAD